MTSLSTQTINLVHRLVGVFMLVIVLILGHAVAGQNV
jgi:hypothetical protein